MKRCRFEDKNGSFCLEQAQEYPYLYFPLAGEKGLKTVVTPQLAGDAKLDQNSFLMEPVSVENLHNNRSSRNFWCHIEGKGCWSASGMSAEVIANRFGKEQEKSTMEAGFMWHRVTRESKDYSLKSVITSFVPVDENVEVMCVELKNIGDESLTLTPTAIIPIYGRSADNLRDHRHVTSLLHRIKTFLHGVKVTPTLSFDERGHQVNHTTYYVCGVDENGETPEDFYPTVDEIVEMGGSFEQPYAIFRNIKGVKAGVEIEGAEAVGGLHFRKTVLIPGEAKRYIILMGITQENEKIEKLIQRFGDSESITRELLVLQEYWRERVNVTYKTGDKDFNLFMKWVSFQPMLRRIFGCSFLPHHDYGKGGRGWRDLWQDCLALLIMNPQGVRQMLLDNFAGVRVDGSNATIIGTRQGEFIADRNNITRVWMDHGVWPFMTTKLYIDQTGDIGLLDEEIGYFKDKQVKRGTAIDEKWNEAQGCLQRSASGECYKGTILEHLLLQNLTAFYEVGEHNMMRLRGADWNDALDMATERGESVAFTNAYAGNLRELAELLQEYAKRTGCTNVLVSKEMCLLLEDNEQLYESIEQKKRLLTAYLESCCHTVSGDKLAVSVKELSWNLLHKADWLTKEIREKEWVEDSKGNGWFNGYYDNHGNRVEGEFEHGVRMMLTGQVFSIMSGVASKEQIDRIIKSADLYLYQEEIGGYRLNTNFKEVKTDLGRMFGFAYGDKENGAVFSHMAVMYGNALYQRGFIKEGFKALRALYQQAMNFEVSRIYPGIPEYFNGKGRGLYHYLTGAASWYMLTVITQMFGIRGEIGDMVIEPKLLADQFDDNGEAGVSLWYQQKKWQITYKNADKKEYGKYVVKEVLMNGKAVEGEKNGIRMIIPKAYLDRNCNEQELHTLEIILG
ncbi:MAG: cellobiose phosphorylase [Lachnospiraceae bacterium]|nr:cellobiose phosphorylase [Lachnospiraceae bacterium]